MFKQCADLISAVPAFKDHPLVVCDFGCAAGEFLYFLSRCFPSCRFCGVDLLPELIAKAKQQAISADWLEGSVLDKDLLAARSSDISLLFGVLGIFDDFEIALRNLIHWTADSGRIYVHSCFNAYPVDVILNYRLSSNRHEPVYETGFNIFSKQSITQFLDSHPRVASCTFHPVELAIDLLPDQEDPLRSWTFQDDCGHRLITNGLSIIQQQSILEIVLVG